VKRGQIAHGGLLPGWFLIVIKMTIVRCQPYQACNNTAKNNCEKTSDACFIGLMPKKTNAVFSFRAMVACMKTDISSVYQD
ncbi:hypothetical protein, partial [Pseudomonas syringae]|uniref:hypothetical protein n=1 Tax=Pseudomonas syringae TaxID=317 RepID=UPI001CA472E1